MSRSLVEILRSPKIQVRVVSQDGNVDLEELRRSILEIAEVLETPTFAERRTVNLPAAPSLI